MTRPVPAVLLVALVTVGMLPACTHRATPQELAAVERMIIATDSMRAVLDRADTNALHHMGARFTAERAGIEARFRDTLLPHEAELLGNYHRAMAERLPRLLAERRAGHALLDSSANRLADLRHDLELGLLDPESRREALAMEQQWATALHHQTDSLVRLTNRLISDRQRWRAAIDTLLLP
ncbi:MAG: hypothetical protein IT230_00265 [Flavobacteriales bacterium]|nr:hypothetical protein [Flavobacteriales bacterium]